MENKTALKGLPALMAALFSLVPTSQAAASFYDPPSNLPNDNGALIRQEPTKLASVQVGGRTVLLDGTGTRIMYRSTDELGTPVAITGTYIEPNTQWKGSGPRPLVSFAMGTMGIGDAAAPSKMLANGYNIEGTHLMVGYEIPPISDFISRGIAVVVTDYLGLGTTDRVHTYINRADLGHSVLDAARAALALPGTSISASSPIGLFGYSEGGSASGAAAELAPTYAPELNLKAAYVGAPASDLGKVLKTIDGTALAGVIGWEISGIFGYHPELKSELEGFLNDNGKQWLDSTDKDTETLADTILKHGFQTTNEYTENGTSALDILSAHPELIAVVDAQRLGKVAPQVPVLLLSGTNDDAVGHEQARQTAIDWCAIGADVTYQPVKQLLPMTGLPIEHFIPSLTDEASTENWLVDRLQGQPAESNCTDIASLP